LRKSIEKERSQWVEKSVVTSSELMKFQQMLELIQMKVGENVQTKEVEKDLELTKTQIKELMEFHKRLKEMSPIR
jgi:hypothetical protein